MSFSQGVRTGAFIGDNIVRGFQRPKLEARQRALEESERQRQQDADQRAQESHRMQMAQRGIELESARREMEREADDNDRAQGLMQLYLMDAYMRGEEIGLDEDFMHKAMMGIFNNREREMIDPDGDGRELSGIQLMPGTDGGEPVLAFEVEGGKVEGTKPITRFRRTAEEGDNQLLTMTLQEAYAYVQGTKAGHYKKYPESQQLMETPEGRSKLRAWLFDVADAMQGKDPREMGDGEELRARHAQSVALENLKQDNREQTARTKHANALKEIEARSTNRTAPADKTEQHTLSVFRALQKEQSDNGITPGVDGYKSSAELLREAKQLVERELQGGTPAKTELGEFTHSSGINYTVEAE